jgi:peptide/nickel transport system substrate-binding protein
MSTPDRDNTKPDGWTLVRVDRRTFLMRGTGGTLLSAGALSALLSACGSSSSSSSTTKASASTGTSVVIGSSEGDPANLDSGATYSFALTATVGSTVHAYLLGLAPNGSLNPDIATSYKVVSPTEVQFTIRDGVMFHNGRKLVPNDVKASFERIVAKSTASPFAPYFSSLKGIEVSGDTVAFHLSAPYAPLPAVTTQIPIIPIETAPQQKTHPIGAGPFKFVQWQQGNFMDFTRFTQYYEPGFPKLEKIRFVPRADATAMLSGFLAKNEDIILGYNWPTKSSVDGAGKSDRVLLNGFQFFLLNTAKAPFNDPRVRQAVSLGTDRAQLATTQYGPGTQPLGVNMDPRSPYYPSDLPSFTYDPAQAKQLLAAAGVKPGLKVEGLLVDLPATKPLGPVWQAQMQKIGIDLTVTVLQPADLINRVITQHDFQITQFGDAAPEDPALFLDRYYETHGTSNFGAYSNPQVDALLNQGDQATDTATRKTIYDNVFKILDKDVPTITWCQTPLDCGLQNDVNGFMAAPDYTFDFRPLTV